MSLESLLHGREWGLDLGKNVKGELFSVDLIFWSTFKQKDKSSNLMLFYIEWLRAQTLKWMLPIWLKFLALQ